MALVVTDTEQFNTSRGQWPTMVEVTSGIVAIAYNGPGLDGFVETRAISPAGVIGDDYIDILEFDAEYGNMPFIWHVTGDVYAVVYLYYVFHGADNGGYVKTFTIDSLGNIGDVIDSLKIFSHAYTPPDGMCPHACHLSGDNYAVVAGNFGSFPYYGTVFTFSIDSSGNISDTVIDSHNASKISRFCRIIKVSGTTYAIVSIYNQGTVQTLTIGNDGVIPANPEIDDLQYETTFGEQPFICHVVGDIYAIAHTGTSAYGYVRTVSISSAGAISDAVINSWTFLEAYIQHPDIIQLSARLYAIAYRTLADFDGWLKTFVIESDGTIDSSDVQTLQVSYDCWQTRAYKLWSGLIAVCYGEATVGDDGWLKTIGGAIVTAPVMAGLNPALMELLAGVV